MASLTASFRVALPLVTGTTRAPRSFMRQTLSAWRSTSTAPMNTVQSSPNSAHAVAVATPCWPAPVSAMTRCLPIRRVSSACPSTLLILCDPVWVRSSRLSSTRTPSRSERLRHSVTGVGRPAYEVSSAAYSARNSSDAHAARNSASSCSSAGINVSGTNWPPKSSKRPAVDGSGPGGPRTTASPRWGDVVILVILAVAASGALIDGPVVRALVGLEGAVRLPAVGLDLGARRARDLDELSQLARVLVSGADEGLHTAAD